MAHFPAFPIICKFYIYKDPEYRFECSRDIESLKRLNYAYYSGNWKEMLK